MPGRQHDEPLAIVQALGNVQLCCDRLAALPDRLRERRPLLESDGGVLLPEENLTGRLAREEQARPGRWPPRSSRSMTPSIRSSGSWKLV